MSLFSSDLPLPGADVVTWNTVATGLKTAHEHGVWYGALFYVISQRLLASYFPRSAYENNKRVWKTIMAVYNFIMSAYSFVTFVYLFDVVRNTQLFANECAPSLLFRNETFRIGVHLFYLSKYVEFADTYFLVIAGREVSWLQYFHHFGAPIDMWFLSYYQNEGIWIFAVFNSLIHTLMYAYYGFTALDVKLNALRIMMTSLQIIQLFSGNVVAAFLPNVPCYASSSNLMFTWAINNIYIITLLFLFANFYKNNYLSKKSKDAAKAKAKKEEIAVQKSE